MILAKKHVFIFCAGLIALVLAKTYYDFSSPCQDFYAVYSDASAMQVTDRNGVPLSAGYHARWNQQDVVALHTIPEFLQAAFISSEDKRFFEHSGVDWIARSNAFWQALTSFKKHRGASTISEQVVRMLHPRPRTLWSKWVEGWEAMALEHQVNKAGILEFYLNQVPYAANRRGIIQAARYYFNRDLHTLNVKEMLSLAVLVRAPSRFDLYKNQVKIDDAINRLALHLHKQRFLDNVNPAHLAGTRIALERNKPGTEALHFLNYIRSHEHNASNKIRTTLDLQLQHTVQELLHQRLQALSPRLVRHGAALVIDYKTNEILAWVSLGAKCKETHFQAESCQIDMVSTPRQPGSALKPFLYAQALEQGWNPDTIIDDSPYAEAVGRGWHRFHNYSRIHYGDVTLRKALGNSLNIPALHTINYVGVENYLQLLHKLGFSSLTKPHYHYDEGLALGNGEVSLFELVQGFAVLANRGIFRPLSFDSEQSSHPQQRVFSEEAASLIGNILSDPWARQLEFGHASILNLPSQTAVKTGTSNDHHDAVAVGYNHRYVVGIWMGNTDFTPMDRVTGATGPALMLRGIFNELNQHKTTAPLYLSPKLVAEEVCIKSKTACHKITEYFFADRSPDDIIAIGPEPVTPAIDIIRPVNGLELAIDPRIPSDRQAFALAVKGLAPNDQVEWVLNGQPIAKVSQSSYLWNIVRGSHTLKAIIWRGTQKYFETQSYKFLVK